MVRKYLPSITLVSWALNRNPSGDNRTWVLEANAMHLSRRVKSRAAGETALKRQRFVDAMLLCVAAVASGSSIIFRLRSLLQKFAVSGSTIFVQKGFTRVKI